MATAIQNDEPTTTEDASAATTTRAPAFKRPEGLSDLQWAILSVAKNEEMVTRIIAIWNGDVQPTPEEAALMLEITKAAEMRTFKAIRRLQADIVPKLTTLSATYSGLANISDLLFSHATKPA